MDAREAKGENQPEDNTLHGRPQKTLPTAIRLVEYSHRREKQASSWFMPPQASKSFAASASISSTGLGLPLPDLGNTRYTTPS